MEEAHAQRFLALAKRDACRLQRQRMLRTPRAWRDGGVVLFARRRARHAHAAAGKIFHRYDIRQAGHADAQNVGASAFGRMHNRIGNLALQALDGALAKACGVFHVRFHMRRSDTHGFCHAHCKEHRLGARTQTALLVTAERGGVHGEAALHIQDADAAWPADLMRARRKQLHTPFTRVDRHLAKRLRGIAM